MSPLSSVIVQRLAVAARAEAAGAKSTFARQAGFKFCWLRPNTPPMVIFAADGEQEYVRVEKQARARYAEILADLMPATQKES